MEAKLKYLGELAKWQLDVATYVADMTAWLTGPRTQSGGSPPPPPPPPPKKPPEIDG